VDILPTWVPWSVVLQLLLVLLLSLLQPCPCIRHLISAAVVNIPGQGQAM
jgi:hypothetical protein